MKKFIDLDALGVAVSKIKDLLTARLKNIKISSTVVNGKGIQITLNSDTAATSSVKLNTSGGITIGRSTLIDELLGSGLHLNLSLDSSPYLYIKDDNQLFFDTNNIFKRKAVSNTEFDVNSQEAHDICEVGNCPNQFAVEFAVYYNYMGTHYTEIPIIINNKDENPIYIKSGKAISADNITTCENMFNIERAGQTVYEFPTGSVNFDFTYFDTSSITSMERMFYGLYYPPEGITITNLDVKNANIKEMFFNSNLYGEYVSSLDVSSLIIPEPHYATCMFKGAHNINIKGLDLKGSCAGLFHGSTTELTNCNIKPIGDCHGMFYNARFMKNSVIDKDVTDLSMFDISEVTDAYLMFRCNTPTVIITGWDFGSFTGGNHILEIDLESPIVNLIGPVYNIKKDVNVAVRSLSKDSIMMLIDGISPEAGRRNITVVRNVLSNSDKALAVSKGWAVIEGAGKYANLIY